MLAANDADTAKAVTLADADALLIGKVANAAAVDGSAASISVTKANLGNTTLVAAIFDDQYTITASAGADLTVLVLESSDDAGEFGVYHWTPASTSDTTVTAAELTILGIYSGDAVAAGDFLIG